MSSCRCPAHPHQRVVGICALCLRERLYEIVESTEPSSDVENAEIISLLSMAEVSSQHTVNIHHHRQHRKPSYKGHAVNGNYNSGCDMKANLGASMKLDADMTTANPAGEYAISAYPYQSQSRKSFNGQDVKSNYVSECDMKANLKPCKALDEDMTTGCAADECSISACSQYVSQPVSARQSNVSECDVKTHLKPFIAIDSSLSLGTSSSVSSKKKKKSSWFAIPKLKPGSGHVVTNSSDVASSNNNRNSLFSHLSISTGRKSASDAISSIHHSKYRQAYTNSIQADLETIAETDRSKKVNNGDSSSSSSWISSFFHRKKSSKFNIKTNATSCDAGRLYSAQPPCLETMFDAGRHSVDSAGLDLQKMVKKKNVQVERSPLQPIDFSNKQHSNYNSTDPMIFGEVPSQNAICNRYRNNEIVSDSENLDADDDSGRIFSKSRLWRREWNKTISPLSHLKQKPSEKVLLTNHLTASAHDHYHHCQNKHNYYHAGSSVHSHVNLKSSMARMGNYVQD